MTLASTLQLNQLVLQNYRCFADCTVDFHPELTVLVADNGFGKTALLDAAAHRAERLFLQRFMDWAKETHDLELWKVFDPTHSFGPREIHPPPTNTDNLFHEFLSIDLTELDDERRAMLDECAAKYKE